LSQAEDAARTMDTDLNAGRGQVCPRAPAGSKCGAGGKNYARSARWRSSPRRRSPRTRSAPLAEVSSQSPCARLATPPAEAGQQTRPPSRTPPARPPQSGEERSEPASPGLAHDRIGDCPSGVSRSRINCARSRRRRASAGPAVVRSTPTYSSIRGSATASRTRGGRDMGSSSF
jgi:hypothetical protein